MRLAGKVALVVGAGQTPGETIGNGRAAAVLFAREGARVFLVDRRLSSAEETAALIADEGGDAICFEADVSNEDDCRAMAAACVAAHDGIDVLQNNVGIGGGDAGAASLEVEVWQRIMDVNLKGMWLAAKHVLPAMRERQSGSIVNISSLASIASTNMLAYKVSKAGVNALTQSLALGNAKHGIRANAVLPGLIDTPMAIEGISADRGISTDQLRQARNDMVPLRSQMGTAWDVAHASLFLASDEAGFITGALLPVDGGQHARVG
jgi:NAD(P)-dependent dehydrogenase (short-subunit alcohol dehydrogenase family)